MNVILFIATVFTTIYAGYLFASHNLFDGVAFAIALLGYLESTRQHTTTQPENIKLNQPYPILFLHQR